jgi:hypothetical protein
MPMLPWEALFRPSLLATADQRRCPDSRQDCPPSADLHHGDGVQVITPPGVGFGQRWQLGMS